MLRLHEFCMQFLENFLNREKSSDMISGFRREDEDCVATGYYFGEERKFKTDVSGQSISPLFRG